MNFDWPVKAIRETAPLWVVALALLVYPVAHRSAETESAKPSAKGASVCEATHDETAAREVDDFDRWLVDWANGDADPEMGLQLAIKREPVMRRLIHEQPLLAYDHALDFSSWDRLPAEIQPHVERRFEQEGRFVVERDCFSERVYRGVTTPSFSVAHASVADDLLDVERYDGLLKGVVLAGDVAVIAMDGPLLEEPVVEVQAAAPSGDLSILWLNVKYSDQTGYPAPCSLPTVKDQLEKYSYGRVSVSYVIKDVAIPSATGVSSDTLREEANVAAAAIGFNPADYDITVYRSTNIGNFAPIGGSYLHVNETREDVALHEICHCLGLSHSNWWEPDPGQPAWGNGTNVLYGQNWNLLGLRPHVSQPRRDLNAVEKKILGWLELDSDYLKDVTSGVYRIYPYDSHAGGFVEGEGVYGVSVFKDTHTEVNPNTMVTRSYARRYFLSFANQPYFDEGTNNPWYANGLLLHWQPWTLNGSDGYGKNGAFGSTIIDAHPESVSGLGTYDGYNPSLECYDAPVLIGETYVDNDPNNRDGDIYITPLRKIDPDGIPRSGDEYIDVKLVIGDESQNQAPTATLTAGAATAYVGETVSFVVDANDADDAELGYLWDFGLGTTGVDRRKMPLNGLPNQQFSWDAPGSYTVSVTVNDGRGGSVSLSETITIVGEASRSWKPEFLAWDAALDAGGDSTWSATGTEYDWVFDGGDLAPVAVTSAKFATLTKAYEFPEAMDTSNASWNGFGSDEPATFEWVLDVDGNNGTIFETGGTTIGFKLDITGGVLQAMIAGSPTTVVATNLTEGEKNDFIHIVVVADNQKDRLELYVDGVMRASSAWVTGDDWSGGNYSGLGSAQSGSADGQDRGAFVGKMALFRFYRDTVFDGPRVVANYNRLIGSAGQPLRTVTYIANGATSGSAPLDANNPYIDGASVTVMGANDLAWMGRRFEGWSTRSDGSEQAYREGDTYAIGSNVMLFAKWGQVTSDHAVAHSWLSSINPAWADDYEVAAAGDQDQDGVPTWLEFWTGTDPMDKESKFKFDDITIDGSNVVLEWRHADLDALMPDVHIMSSPDLNPNSWTTEVIRRPVNGTNTASIPIPSEQRFYRLAIPNIP